MFRCVKPPEELRDFARRVEELGYDELWVVEDCFFAGAISSAAVAASVTERITIGIGILPAVLRNPALAAMELASLERLFPGRLIPGFGHGVADWMRQVGAFPPSQLAALRESIDAVRRLLAGETVTTDGTYVHFDNVKLDHPPAAAPPIVAGVRSEKSLRLSGEVANGTLLAELASPTYQRWARGHIDAGREAAGRTDPHQLITFAHFDLDPARTNARAESAQSLFYRTPFQLDDEELAARVRVLVESSGSPAELAEALPDEALVQFAVAGSADDCVTGVRALVDAGSDSVVFVPPNDTELALVQLDRAASEVLPALR
jgi:alkanesulfonate monooxygenase SsuD/methylene tetrahydromethanopterin reductase-like flavin-dependent oxidoreductase (luciferase family)